MTQLQGKLALVTGATSGIGMEASIKLAAMGAKVVIVGRDPARSEQALGEIRRRSGSNEVTLLTCDFSSQRSIRALAAEFRQKFDRLDILVNNAGGVSPERRETEDGIEQTFAVNHVGYFLLTTLLLDLIEKSAPARIVNVASIGHRGGSMDFDNLGYEKGGYAIMGAYARSKLANVLFTRELARRLDGKGVTVNCLHPGTVATNIWSKAPGWAQPILNLYKWLFMITPEKGAGIIVYLASSPEVEGKTGGYYEKNKLLEPSKLARDEALAKKLWEVSEGLIARSKSA